MRISKHAPKFGNGRYHNTFNVRIRRVRANEFAMKNRFETSTEKCTVFTQFMHTMGTPEKWMC